jgi:penicillin G amidase
MCCLNPCTFRSVLAILTARSLSEFDTALQYLSASISLNFGYADTAGNIGYCLCGEVPDREALQRGDELLPRPGWDSKQIAKGYIPHAKLPKDANPESGFIISANHQAVDYSTYPIYLGQVWKAG